MVKCQVEKCCCGCSLKLGVILIGVVNIINFLGGISLLIQYSQNSIRSLEIYGFISGGDLIAMSLIGLLGLLIAILLIWGARKDVPRLLHIGMLIYIICVILQAIIFTEMGIRHFIHGRPTNGALDLFKVVVGLMFGIYFSIVINSLRTKLEGGANPGGPRNY